MSFLSQLGATVKDRFVQGQSILSFAEFMEQVEESPAPHCRTAAAYLKDLFEFFGSEDVPVSAVKAKRFKLFDQDFPGGGLRVAGQEEVQTAIHRILANFVREGRINKLVLLHGPNGSAKSSIVNAIIKGLEHYSALPEGKLYSFSWIFPAEKVTGGGIGFGADSEPTIGESDSFAHLTGDLVDSRLECPVRDNPLLLLPITERTRLFDELREKGALPADFSPPHAIGEGELCHRCRMVFDALMTHYGGDFSKVLRHIQVHRVYFSQRYRRGAVQVEPQMHVDASVRLLTTDRTIGALPRYLSNLNIFEPMGPLVDANRGMIDYTDFLKRPPEAFKYLLSTCETNRVNVEPTVIDLDLFMVGSTNENNLAHFREYQEFVSFKGRMELVKVPYLLRYSEEKQIYDSQVLTRVADKHVAPHVTEIAALWAVLTRQHRNRGEDLEEDVATLVRSLSPLEKALLLDHDELPGRFSEEEAKKVRSASHKLMWESRAGTKYEGRIGASPREVKTILLNAAQSREHECLSPPAVLKEIERLVREDKEVYLFLQQKPDGDFHNHQRLVEVVRDHYLDLIDAEIHASMGLIEARRYEDRLARYVEHVKAQLTAQKVRNPITGDDEDPDETLMRDVERLILPEDGDRKSFREALMQKIASFRIEHPDDALDISGIFSSHLKAMENAYYDEKRDKLRKIKVNFLIYTSEDRHLLAGDEKTQVETMLRNAREDFGYCEACAREAVSFLLSHRYKD